MQSVHPVIPLENSCPWSHMEVATIKYCENNLCSWITTPANTWTNLSYIIIGVFLCVQFLKAKKNLDLFFGLVVLAVGISSFLYHASFSFVFQIFDYMGMYLFSSMLLVLNAKRLGWLKDKALVPVYLLLTIVSCIPFIISKGSLGRGVFGFHILLVIITECLATKIQKEKGASVQHRSFFLTLVFFFVAYGFWILDSSGIWCDPNNHYVQGHAIWHVVNSLCFLSSLKFYRQFEIEK